MKKIQLAIYLPADLIKQFKHHCIDNETKVSDMVQHILEQHLAQNKDGEGE